MGNLILAETLTAPSGLWAIILNWIQSSVANFAWTIILFTLLIKVCLSPLDFFIKWSTKKSTLVQQKCAPQIAKLQKKYANNQQALQIQTNAIYKKEGLNMGASCIVMLVNLVVTLVVFLTIFNSLKDVSAYQAIKQYQALENAYQTAYTQVSDEKFTTLYNEYKAQNYTTYYEQERNRLFEAAGLTFDAEATYDAESDEGKLIAQAEKFAEDKVKAEANAVIEADPRIKDAVKATWNKEKESWLWITNIWVTDGKADPLPTYSGIKGLANSASKKLRTEYVKTVESIGEGQYNKVTAIVHDGSSGWNGYYILAILAAGVTFLSTYIAELGNKLKRGKDKKEEVKKANQFIKTPETEKPATTAPQMNGSMKFMKILMPIVMVIFVVTSSAAFGLYVVTQSLVSIGIGALINLIVNKITYKKQLEVLEYLDKIEGKKKK